MSSSTLNARSIGRPPAYNNLKRKEMADVGGEIARPPPPNSRIKSGHLQAKSLSSISREPPNPFSMSSRSTSVASSRKTSNSSLASSVGSSFRPQSAQAQRVYGMNGASGIKRPGAVPQRPVTSLEVHHEETSGDQRGHNQLGRTPFSSRSKSPPLDGSLLRIAPLRSRKTSNQDRVSERSGSPVGRATSWRSISIASRMQKLSLDDKPNLPAPKSKKPPSNASQIPILSPVAPSPLPDAARVIPKTPSKSAKNGTPFLSKTTNVKSEWETNTKWKEMCANQSTVMDTLSSMNSERSRLEDQMASFGSRGKSLLDLWRPGLTKHQSPSSRTRRTSRSGRMRVFRPSLIRQLPN